jgi:uncharacterized tellurite resistance protein B-like protein
MVLRRFLGLGNEPPTVGAQPAARGGTPAAGETETVRRIIRELEQLEPDQRMFLAGFAYILTRAAHADLDISTAESALMEQIVTRIGKLPEAQAVLVVEIAKHQSELYGGTEDFLVTREFKSRATDEQKRAAVAACFAVAAADHQITSDEYAELTQIADELDLSREELNVIRREYVDQLAAIKRMRGDGR